MYSLCSVYSDVFLVCDAFVDEKLGYIFPFITLQLQNSSVVLIFNYVGVTVEGLIYYGAIQISRNIPA